MKAAVAFTAVIDHAIDEIRELPDAWPLWAGRNDVRRRILRSVPYSIIYVVGDGGVVAHHKRRPGYWLHRAAP